MDWPLVGRADLLDSIGRAIRGEPGNAVLEGEIGAGKSRLARAVAATLAADGWHVEICVCSEAARAVPFGALSHLVPARPSSDLLLLFEETRRAVVAAAKGARFLLVVDDAHHLDRPSMALVHRLAASSGAPLLLTRRAGEEGNDETIASLWKDRFARRFDVPPLDRGSHDEVVGMALGRVAAASVCDRLWQLTQGNPLFLTELLRLAIERGVESDLETVLGSSAPSRLTQIVRSRLERLSPEARRAFDILAVAEPVRLDALVRLCGRDPLVELQRRAVVAVDRVGGSERVRSAHPLYALTARAGLPPVERAAFTGDLARAIASDGLGDPGDALKVATCLLDAGETPDAALALSAAREALARTDPELSERLARSAIERRPSAAALVTLGTALSVQHKHVEAAAVLEGALRRAGTDDERVDAALAASRHRVWMERDVAAGTALLEQVIRTLSSPGAGSELRAELAIFSAVAGDTVNAARLAGDVLSDSGAHPRAVLSALVQSTLARTMLGRFAGLEADLDRGDALAAAWGADAPRAADQLGITRAVWLQFVDLAAARGVVARGYERALREGGATGLWSGTHAWLLLDAGDLDAALGIVGRALAEVERFDPFHNMPMIRALAALVHALRGETAEARHALVGMAPAVEMEPRTRVWADRAELWIAAQQPERAAALAVAAGDRAQVGTMIAWAALLYHDAVRLGHAARAVDPLTHLARETDGAPLIALRAEHARAVVDRNPESLVRIAERFTTAGSPLLAAEALSQAADCSDGPRAARLSVRALHLQASCPGAATPPLARLASPLSQREQEIASLAAAGASSREIAARLYVSARTVDNHLASVYRKLGLAGRDELKPLFE